MARKENTEFERYCPRCKNVKPITEFYNSKGKCIRCVREYGIEYSTKNKEKIRLRKRKYSSKKSQAYSKQYRKSHKEYYREYSKIYLRKKRKIDVKYSIDQRMSRSINKALKHNGFNKNNVGWNKFVDYTVGELKDHLKSKFKKGMTWERFLNGEIHIDHKIPKIAFHYNSPNDIDFKRCWALENLQPMWAKDNIKKRATLQKPFQPSLNISI